MEPKVTYGPEGTTLVWVEETGKYYLRVDVGDISYLFDTPEGLGLSEITDYDPRDYSGRDIDSGAAEDMAQREYILELANSGQLEIFETEEEFEGATLGGDERAFLYVDTSITNIASDIMGRGDEGDEDYVKGQGIDAITQFLGLLEKKMTENPKWGNDAYLDAIGRAYIEYGDLYANPEDALKALGISETGQTYNEFIKSIGLDPLELDAWDEFDKNPDTFYQKVEDYKLELQRTVEGKGGSLSDEALTYAAEEWAWGRWSASKAKNQVIKAVDPYAYGEKDPGFAGVIGGEGFAKTTLYEHEVQELIDTWLPTSLHKKYEEKISEYAGKIRKNPNFKNELIEEMKDDRFALYPQYDRKLSFSNILAGKKSSASQVWGIDMNNIKSDDPIILKMIQENNPSGEAEMLRNAGIDRGYAAVLADLNRAMTSSFGTGVIRSQGFTEQG
tara:strand:+ start:10252 stop:11589 length:1338 start_codon:yes stop_codon:yes gene_type:complete